MMKFDENFNYRKELDARYDKIAKLRDQIKEIEKQAEPLKRQKWLLSWECRQIYEKYSKEINSEQ